MEFRGPRDSVRRSSKEGSNNIFYQWQLSQQPNGNRESSSTAMLPQEVKERKNLVIKVGAWVRGFGVWGLDRWMNGCVNWWGGDGWMVGWMDGWMGS